MRIEDSLEWSSVETELMRKAGSLSNGRDVRRMIGNIKFTVAELSKSEVHARRGKKNAADALLKKVNDEIEMVEEYLLIAALLG